jgi:large subunit ribosomal protein L6
LATSTNSSNSGTQLLSKKRIGLNSTLDLPSNVSATFNEGNLTVKGPLGEVRQDFSKIPVAVKINGSKVELSTTGSRRADNAVLNTARSLIRNSIDGVSSGYEYKLKVIFAHFPVSVKVQGNRVLIENFYGERSPRIAEIIGDTKVQVQGEDIVVTGVSVKDVGQTAANLEQATTVRRKDQRVFLDGIYVYERTRKAKV